MNATCHAVHKAYQDEAFDEFPLLIGTLSALDGDCAHAERSVNSIVRSMGTPLEYQRHFGQSNILGVGRRARPKARKSRSGAGTSGASTTPLPMVPTGGIPNPNPVPTPQPLDGSDDLERHRQAISQGVKALSREEQLKMVHELFPGTPSLFSVPFQAAGNEQPIEGVPYMTQGYLAYLAERAQQLRTENRSVCTPDLLFDNLAQTRVDEIYTAHDCEPFYFPEVDPGTPYYKPGFFTAEQTASYQVAKRLFGLRDAYQNADPSLTRLTRQLIAAAGMAAGFVLSKISNSVLGWLGFGKKEGPDRAEVQRINVNTAHVGEVANHLGRVEKITEALAADEEMLENAEKKTMAVMKLVVSTRAFLDQSTRISEGLIDLTHRHLSPTLVDTDLLYKGLRELEFEASKQQEMLLIQDYSEIWNLRMSYFMTANRDLLVVIHLPVGRMDSKHEIYEYISTPLAMSGSPELEKVHFVVNPPKSLVAYNPLLSTKMEMSTAEYDNCPHITDGTRYCPKWGYTYKSVRPSCVMSLYEANISQLVDYCPISAFAERPYVAQIGFRDFFTYVAKPTTARISCRGPVPGPKTVTLNFLQRSSVRADCKVETDDFTLEPVIEFGKKEGFYQSADLTFDRVNYSRPLDWAHKNGRLANYSTSSAPTMSEIASDWHLDKLRVDAHWTLLQWVSILCGAASLFLFALWMVKCCWDVAKRRSFGGAIRQLREDVVEASQRVRYLESLGGKRRKRPSQEEELEMSPMNPSAPPLAPSGATATSAT
jgi:hypothetical protein